MSKHNLVEYGLAREAVEDLPKLKKELDIAFKQVYKYREYLAASYTLDAIMESLQLLDRQYNAAKQIVETKGQE